jgi:hypothetical protein
VRWRITPLGDQQAVGDQHGAAAADQAECSADYDPVREAAWPVPVLGWFAVDCENPLVGDIECSLGRFPVFGFSVQQRGGSAKAATARVSITSWRLAR